ATRGARLRVELLDHAREVGHGEADRDPAVAVGDDAVEALLVVRPEEDRRVRLLGRLRPLPDAIELDELAVERRLVLGPDALHREDALALELPAPLVVGAVVLHLLDVPAGADAEEEAAVGER